MCMICVHRAYDIGMAGQGLTRASATCPPPGGGYMFRYRIEPFSTEAKATHAA